MNQTKVNKSPGTYRGGKFDQWLFEEFAGEMLPEEEARQLIEEARAISLARKTKRAKKENGKR